MLLSAGSTPRKDGHMKRGREDEVSICMQLLMILYCVCIVKHLPQTRPVHILLSFSLLTAPPFFCVAKASNVDIQECLAEVKNSQRRAEVRLHTQNVRMRDASKVSRTHDLSRATYFSTYV